MHQVKFKILLLTLGSNLFIQMIYGQIIAPAPYNPNATINYVRTWEIKSPQLDLSLINSLSSTDNCLMTTQYLDGLGRSIQTVAKQVSPLKNDFVRPIFYDDIGREQLKYLDFPSNGTGNNISISDG